MDSESVRVGYFRIDAEGVLTECAPGVAELLMDQENSRIVASTDIEGGFVSTAFLPICLMFEDGSPQAFETVVVRNQKSIVVKRYADLAEALKGHDQILETLK